MTTQDYIDDLYALADKYYVPRSRLKPILENRNFLFQSGSLFTQAHHHGKGGLIKHTWEVLNLAMQTRDFFIGEHDVNVEVLFLAAVYHDYGKCWDYEYDVSTNTFVDATTKHRRLIHHISRSAIEWEIIARGIGIADSTRDAVTHCILSHHGHRDYGSPVHPFSREAWILHLSDNMSARCNDCDRIDMLRINKNK